MSKGARRSQVSGRDTLLTHLELRCYDSKRLLAFVACHVREVRGIGFQKMILTLEGSCMVERAGHCNNIKLMDGAITIHEGEPTVNGGRGWLEFDSLDWAKGGTLCVSVNFELKVTHKFVDRELS